MFLGCVGLGLAAAVWAGVTSSNTAGGQAPASASPPAVQSAAASDEAARQAAAATVASEADALITQFKEVVTACDEAGDVVKTRVQSPDSAPDEIYSAAKTAEGLCEQSFLGINNNLHPPSSADGATSKRFADVLGVCVGAYNEKKHTYETLAAAIDGGMTPSKVAAFKERAEAANEALAQCVPALMLAVKKAGGKQSGLDDSPAPAKAE